MGTVPWYDSKRTGDCKTGCLFLTSGHPPGKWSEIGDMKNKFAKTTSLTIAALIASIGASYAQDVSTRDVLDALKPKVTTNKQMSNTRSFSVQKKNERVDTVDAKDRSFINNLSTSRAIRVEQKEKLIEIVEKKELPKIDVRILFDYDSARSKPSSYKSLDQISVVLLDESLAQSKIMLNGHTDAAGSRLYNQDLSERRALSVKRYLIEYGGVPGNRLVVAGFGEDRLRDEYDPLNAINRRVEIVNLGH